MLKQPDNFGKILYDVECCNKIHHSLSFKCDFSLEKKVEKCAFSKPFSEETYFLFVDG